MFDVAIIGAGIAGASLAAELAPLMRVALIEAEDQPGYHSTGRSNALWHETYGGPDVQPLTTASLADLVAGGFLRQRDAITLGRSDQLAEIQSFVADFADLPVKLDLLNEAELRSRIPGLLPGWSHGILEANCFDIDVAGLHAAALSKARRAGAELIVRQRISAAKRRGNWWHLAGIDARIVVNAAGGWSNDVAELFGAGRIAVQPYRRTIAQIRLARPVDPNLAFLIDVAGSFYFRPEGGRRVWLSPFDETETVACDVAAEELDVAIAIDRFQNVVDWPVEAVERSWAGLRSFAADRLPVYGFDPDTPGFFWCVGQGGFGIQTAPAAARLCAALITGNAPDSSIAGIDPARYSPARFA